MEDFVNNVARGDFEKLLSGTQLKSNYTPGEFLQDSSRIIAFYLPQYHEVAENSEWWGKGFTDWVNVAKARPLFEGHYQPHIPRDLGFYDASLESTLSSQVNLAKEYGLYGFCFYWYWFDGKRMLSAPIETFLKSDLNFPFCFCWANESWARTWDNNPSEILIKQVYSTGWQKKLIQDLAVYWMDNRYIKVDNRPLLLIYRAKIIPNYFESIKILRETSMELLGLDPYIVVVDFYDVTSASEFGADALVEFPPHKFWHEANQVDTPNEQVIDFEGRIIDYKKVIVQSITRQISKEETIFRTLMPSWDNTARIGKRAVIIQNTNPKLFKVWLDALRQFTRENRQPNTNFLFVNAWNEWAEGAHLEPDLYTELGYLNQIKKSKFFQKDCSYLSMDYMLESLELADDKINRNPYFSPKYYSSANTIKMKLASKIHIISPSLYRLLRRLYKSTLG